MAEELIGGSGFSDDSFRAVQERLRQHSEEAARAADAESTRSPELRVVIADDQDLVRSGFRLILSSYENLRVVGEARDGQEALERVRETRPDVVLMDIRMPIKNGIEVTREIVGDPDLADTRVLILTTFDVDEYVYDALSAGASGFMLKDSEPDDIAEAIRIVAQGNALIQPSVTRRLVKAFVSSRNQKAHVTSSLSVLTDREREILALVARGLTNEEIANEVTISPTTAKTHVAHIMSKLGAHDRAQLVVIAYENKLVVPGA